MNHKTLLSTGSSAINDSAMDDFLTNFDWSRTAMGDRKFWSPLQRAVINTCIHSKAPLLTLWGEDMIQVYNEAYSNIIGAKHPLALGARFRETWSEIWPETVPMLEAVFKSGKSFVVEDYAAVLNRNGHSEQCYFTFSYSPVYNEVSTIEGVFVSVTETTSQRLSNGEKKIGVSPQAKNLFNQAPVALAILKGPGFLVETANKKILDLWGKTAEQVMNRPLFEAMPVAINKACEKLLYKVFHNGERVVLEEPPFFLERNGKTEDTYIRLVCEPLREQDDSISGVMVFAEDLTSQVNTGKQLELMELRQKITIAAAKIGTFDLDIVQSTFQYSDRFAQLFGYSAMAGLNQESFYNRIHPDNQQQRKDAHQLALETGDLFYEARVIWPDNTLHWIRINGKVIYDINRRPVSLYGTAIDIEIEKQKEADLEKLVSQRTAMLLAKNKELKISEERYHKMVEEVQDYAIILLDKNGIIQNWNKGAEKIKQYHESEIIGKPFQLFYLPQDRANKLPETLLLEAAERGRAFHEGWRLRKNHTKFWGSITLTALHNDNNEIIGFTKVTRDLTQTKLAQDQQLKFTEELKLRNEALATSEERYHKMISEVTDYAIILLNNRGDIQNWNAGAEKIKGYSADEIVGKNFKIFYTAADRERNLPEQLLAEAVKNRKAIHEGWRMRKDGSAFWGSIVITTLRDSQGALIGFSKVTRDLTEKKYAEDRMQEYLLELEAQNRELDQFAYVASHDLQEPLRKIRVFTELIEKNFQDAVLTKKYFGKINASAKRMSDLIISILNYSRNAKDNEEMSAVDLNEIVKNIRSDFELIIHEKKAILESEPLPVIKAVALQVNQLFANLISNALKFSDKQPVIRISSAIIHRDQIKNLSKNLFEDNYLEISFADNGIGFDQQYEQLIFSMFQRLHGRQEYTGTGIGLALCKKIMENHHGFITAKSESFKGAVFYVYFPVNSTFPG